MTVAGDNGAAMAFLEEWLPGGPWTVVAIDPERKGPIEAETFLGGPKIGDLGRWLDRWNGKRNLYFCVNPLTRAMDKKPARTDIAALCWLHCDLDPRAGEDLDEERAAIRDLLGANRPEDIPEPTVVIFSGGGFQAFWKLAEPVEIGGDLDKAEAAKLWSLGLERKFGDRADGTHNIDRIMRLPGSLNLPNATKRRKGRTVTRSRSGRLAWPSSERWLQRVMTRRRLPGSSA